MKRRKTISVTLQLLFLLLISSLTQVQCRHEGINVSTLQPVCFDTQIAPIFINNCGSCHGLTRAKGDYIFTDYTSILNSITPYNAEKSVAYQAITGKAFKQLMPPGIPLSENDRILIRVWIDQGALNTICSTPTGGNGGNGGNGGTGGTGGTGSQVCFQRDILPILLSSCGTTGCHDQTTAREDYVITSYATVMSNLVVAGAPNSSRLYTVVANNNMPPNSYAKLTTAEKDSIFNWIKDGALNSTCTSSCDTTGTVTYQNQISAIMTTNCISCHSGSSAQKGVLLDSYANVKVNMDNGFILSAVQGVTLQMPPGGQLTTCQIRQLEIWKATGELQN